MKQVFPAGPRSFVPLKNFLSFRKDPLAFFGQLRSYGEVSHTKLMGRHFFLINDPALIKTVLLDNSGRYTKGPALIRARILLGDGLLTSEGDLHTRQKRLMMPAFHRTHIPHYGEAMVACAEKVMATWQDGQALDLRTEMMKATLDIAGSTLFGASLEGEAVEISRALGAVLRVSGVAGFPGQELLRHLPLPSSVRFHEAHRHLDDLVYRMIQQRRDSSEERLDLMTMLLRAQDADDGSTMTDQQVRDEVMTLFIAGHETTSNALSWCWMLLAQNPGVLAKLEEELAAVLQGRRPTAADYPKLSYTEMVFSEALRLYPPAWAMGRSVKEAHQLGPWHLPKKSLLVMSQWLMHRDPRYWDQPDTFNPERFSPEAKAARLPYTYFPFSAGPRGCIGDGFAWMEGVLLVAAFAQKWRFELQPGQVVLPQPQITLRPKDGLPVVLKKR